MTVPSLSIDLRGFFTWERHIDEFTARRGYIVADNEYGNCLGVFEGVELLVPMDGDDSDYPDAQRLEPQKVEFMILYTTHPQFDSVTGIYTPSYLRPCIGDNPENDNYIFYKFCEENCGPKACDF